MVSETNAIDLLAFFGRVVCTLKCLHKELPIIFLGALELHHHGKALLINVLKQVRQRLLQTINLAC